MTCVETTKPGSFIKKRNYPKYYFITDNSYGDHSQIVKCSDCGLVHCSPKEASKKLVERYQAFEDPNYEKERQARTITHERVFRNINNLHNSPGKLLDIGCATGTLLGIAQENGWKAVGVEPSKWASKIGKKNMD